MLVIVLSLLGAVSTVCGGPTCVLPNGWRVKGSPSWLGKIVDWDPHTGRGQCKVCLCGTNGRAYCAKANDCPCMDDDQCLNDAWSNWWGGPWKCEEQSGPWGHCTGIYKHYARLCCNKSCDVCPVERFNSASYLGRRLEKTAGEFVDESEYDESELEQMTEEELAAFLEELGTHPHKSAVVEVDDSTAGATNTTEPDAPRRLAARLDTN